MGGRGGDGSVPPPAENSELEVQRQLQDTRIVSGRNLTEGGVGRNQIGISELRVIEHIERIAAKFRVERLPNPEMFRERQIEVRASWAAEVIPGSRAVCVAGQLVARGAIYLQKLSDGEV